MARFEFEIDGTVTAPGDKGLWLESQRMQLPDDHAPLKDQREAARAMRLLFPDVDLVVYSITDKEDGTQIRRTVKV